MVRCCPAEAWRREDNPSDRRNVKDRLDRKVAQRLHDRVRNRFMVFRNQDGKLRQPESATLPSDGVTLHALRRAPGIGRRLYAVEHTVGYFGHVEAGDSVMPPPGRSMRDHRTLLPFAAILSEHHASIF